MLPSPLPAVYDLLDAQHELLVLRNTTVQSDFFVDGLTETDVTSAEVRAAACCARLAAGSVSVGVTYRVMALQQALGMIWPAHTRVRLALPLPGSSGSC